MKRKWWYEGNTEDIDNEIFIDLKNPKQWDYTSISMNQYLAGEDFGRWLVQRPAFKGKNDDESTNNFVNGVINQFGGKVVGENQRVREFVFNYLKQEMPLDEDDVYNCRFPMVIYSSDERFIICRVENNKEVFVDIRRNGNNASGCKIYTQDLNLMQNSFDDLSWNISERVEEVGGKHDVCTSFNIYEREDGSCSVEQNIFNITANKENIASGMEFNLISSTYDVMSDGSIGKENVNQKSYNFYGGCGEADTFCESEIMKAFQTVKRVGELDSNAEME